MKVSTVKKICFAYDKNRRLLTHLQTLCSNEKKAGMTGHLNRRDPVLSYNKELDFELADWISCSLDLGFIITRENIQNKALELIQPSTPQFRASDSCLSCFLNRNCFSSRKLNEKSLMQKDQENLLKL